MAIPSATVTFPFSGGLSTHDDPRQQNPPALDICKNVEFDTIGALQTRKPFQGLATEIAVTLDSLANCRRLATYKDELLLFTKDTLYSFSQAGQHWISRGTHLAIKVDEANRFVTPGEQTMCDRAEFVGSIVYTWVEASTVWVAAIEKATGVVTCAPTTIAGTVGDGSTRPRLVVMATSVLIFYNNGSGDLKVKVLDPTDVATGLAVAPTTVLTAAGGFNVYYDAVRIASTDTAALALRLNPTTSYRIVTVTSGLSVTGSTKARVCDGPIAISVSPDGVSAQIVRQNGLNIQGDLIAISGLTDTYTAQAIGTTAGGASEIAAAHRSVQDSGKYRCYAFWTEIPLTSTVTNWSTKSNWVDTGSTLGTQATFVSRVECVSRAFDRGGHVFVWLGFGTTVGLGSPSPTPGVNLEDTYFLYRDDGFLCAKAMANNAGGWESSRAVSRLPGVNSLGSDSYAWCGTSKSEFSVLAASTATAGRAPRDIVFTFDSNEARRTVELGDTLYITGGEVLQYDGRQLTEVGFHIYPYAFSTASAGAGAVDAGTHAYKVSWSWRNAAGDIDRSTAIATETFNDVACKVRSSDIDPLYITHKVGSSTVGAIAAEMWRTLKDPTADSPFYLVTSTDPSNATNPNRYISNDTTAAVLATFDDNYADGQAGTKRPFPENGDVVESIAPPAATVIARTDTRVFLAGIAGDDRVWYSKQRNDGDVAAFSDALVIVLPQDGGAVTAIAKLNETLIVFREHAIYALPGDGFTNTAQGANYGPARTLSLDVGAVNQESVALMPEGLIFKCTKGWYLLDRGWNVKYIGAPVYAYDSETPLAINVMESQHQVRILTANRMLVWDYLVNQWGEWTISGGLDAVVWNGAHVYLTTTGPYQQLTTFAGVDYGFDVETSWIKINSLQGRGIVRSIEVLGEYRGAHRLQVRLARNYQSDGAGGVSYFQDKTWTVTPTTVGGPEQVRMAPSIKRPIQAIKVRLTTLAPGGGAPTGETCKLSGVSLAVAVEDGLYEGAVAQKQ